MLAAVLRNSVSNINEKISKMGKKGELIRLKRGVYAWGELYRERPVDKIAAANRLFSPSYVSFEYALAYHGLIPERVYEVTSATTKPKKSFDTPLGRFSYRTVPARVYALGIQWLYDEKEGGRLIATPEKALCDTLRAKKGLGRLSQKRVLEFLEEDMRIEPEDLFALDSEAIRAIAVAYGSPLLRELGVMIAKRRKTR
jgi:predicted transcriptional regulator of viral defense system